MNFEGSKSFLPVPVKIIGRSNKKRANIQARQESITSILKIPHGSDLHGSLSISSDALLNHEDKYQYQLNKAEEAGYASSSSSASSSAGRTSPKSSDHHMVHLSAEDTTKIFQRTCPVEESSADGPTIVLQDADDAILNLIETYRDESKEGNMNAESAAGGRSLSSYFKAFKARNSFKRSVVPLFARTHISHVV